MSRNQLPIRQRHIDGCAQRDCACPWSFRARLPDGSQPRVTRDTYADAEQEYYSLMARRPEPLADRTTTIGQWAQRFLDGGQWAPATRERNTCSVRNHIVPGLGDYLVTELTHDLIRLWAKRMRDAGTGPAAMKAAVETLRTMYGVWQESDRFLPRGVPIPRGLVKQGPRKEFDPLTETQVDAWAGAMPAPMALVVELEAWSGGRESEILGLQEEDIAWRGKDVNAPLAAQLARLATLPREKYAAASPRLRFSRQLSRYTREGTRTKNDRANRTLQLDEWLAVRFATQLQSWPPANGWLFTTWRAYAVRTAEDRARDRAEQYARHCARVRGEDIPLRTPGPLPRSQATALRWVTNGKPLTASSYNWWLRKAAKTAEIVLPPNQCSHALRHHAVSVLRDKGLDDDAIGKWIGDSAETVRKVYGRPMPDAMARMAAVMSESRTGDRRLRAVPD